MMKPEDKIRIMSGVSKRLFMALSDFRSTPPQLEDALYQLASVIDATSKYHYPGEGATARYTKYLDSVTTDVFRIASLGKLNLIDCSFKGRDGKYYSFGKIIYGIRNSSFHDPNEVDQLVHWGEENNFGVNGGRLVVNQSLLTALFLILISDDANKDKIDTCLFTDEHFLRVNEKQYPFHMFVGKRPDVFSALGLGS